MENIIISTGQSRFTKIWKQTEISWNDLCERLKTTTRTTETQGQYFNMPKGEQDNIKDVGGFVGGSLKEGKRTAGNADKRYILTLDADFADPEHFLDDVRENIKGAYCVYSTHKHTPEKPRLRLIMPFNRPVGPEEYEAIARRISADIAIDAFDDTTYQPQRLMYWPSTSIDGNYFYYVSDGDCVNVDDVLNRYDNWRDVTSWPSSSRTVKKRERLIKKQEDPTGKIGLVGAFCRTYDIYSVIDNFLADVYIECASGDRYTYSEGSTAAGLVVYEDGKFAYSNHATDPAGGELCNAFDLCRIHLFGDEDENVKPNTPISKTPSYMAMLDFVKNDGNVKKLMHHERQEESKTDFAGVGADEDTDWVLNLETDNRGNNLKTRDNIVLILENDSAIKNKIALNTFTNRIQVLGAVAWDTEKDVRDWSDNDDAGLRYYIEKAYGIDSEKRVLDAHKIVSMRHKFNPVKEYLESAVWDEKKRVETLFIDYLGAKDNAYIRATTKKSLVAAVARIFNPGVKFDSMPVLVGPQGCGKSQIIKKLGGEWFSDTLTTMQGKEAYEQIQGFWIIEIAELTAMRRSEIEAVKHFVSKSEDAYRAAYGRRTVPYKRQCVFFGTTNTYEFLRDMTGNRRFWPIDVEPEKASKSMWKELSADEIAQIWAEAVRLYLEGETLYIDDKNISDLAKQEQESHLDESPLTGDVQRYLEIKLPEDWQNRDLSARRAYIHNGDFGSEPRGDIEREYVCPLEIWCEMFFGDRKDFNRQRSREIKDILSKIEGWEDMKKLRKFGKIYGPQRGFMKLVTN